MSTTAVRAIRLDDIHITERLRALQPERVETLVASIARAAARKERATATPKPTKKAAPPVEIGPRRLRLADLRRALAARQRLSAA